MESIIFRIMNLKEYHQLYEETEQLSDTAERESRLKLLEQIMEKHGFTHRGTIHLENGDPRVAYEKLL